MTKKSDYGDHACHVLPTPARFSPEARKKAAETGAANRAAKALERDERDAAWLANLAAIERDFPVKCSVRIIEPKNKARHGKYGKVVTHNTDCRGAIEIGVRVNVAKPKPGVRKSEPTGIDAWYLPSELVRELPPK